VEYYSHGNSYFNVFNMGYQYRFPIIISFFFLLLCRQSWTISVVDLFPTISIWVFPRPRAQKKKGRPFVFESPIKEVFPWMTSTINA
jgi:hypothetical protein